MVDGITMSAPPKVIDATFYAWRMVLGRKRLQLIFEVDLERQTEILTMLGPPLPDRHIPCAIALLDVKSIMKPLPHPRERIERREFCDLPYTQQAGILSNDERFAEFIGALPGYDCAEEIRKACGVATRKDIVAGTTAGNLWRKLLRAYEAHQ